MCTGKRGAHLQMETELLLLKPSRAYLNFSPHCRHFLERCCPWKDSLTLECLRWSQEVRAGTGAASSPSLQGFFSPCPQAEVTPLHTFPVPVICICVPCLGDVPSEPAPRRAQGAGRETRGNRSFICLTRRSKDRD